MPESLNYASSEQRATLTLTSLHEDVLLDLFHYLTAKGHLSVISTCRSLLDTGLSALLARPYHLTGGSLRSFHNFLSFFAPASFLSLRKLAFESNFTGPEIVIIAALLQRATNLQVLFMNCHILDRSPALIKAIASLSSLRGLQFHREDHVSSRTIVQRLKAPLVRLYIQDGKPLTPFLSDFSQTLEDVYIPHLSFTDVFFSFPKVTRLILHDFHEGLLPVLIKVFPQLQVLSIHAQDILRAMDIASQAYSQLKSLRVWTVTSLGLYIAGLGGKVNSVIVQGYTVFSDDMSIDYTWIQTPLRSLRPRHLLLACRNSTAGLIPALAGEMEELDRLDLVIEISGNHEHNGIMVSVMLASKRSHPH